MAEISWYCAINGQQKGPFTEQQVAGLITAGAVNEHTKVWSADLAEWTPLYRTALRALLGDRPIQPPALEPAPPSPGPRPAQHQTPSYAASPSQSYAPPPTVHSLPNPHAALYSPRRNRGLGLAVVWGFAACAATTALLAILTLSGGDTYGQYERIMSFAQAPWMWLISLPSCITAIVFLCWKYRATVNLFYLRGPQSVSPAGAMYWYFVPIAWFWKPFIAMRNLVRGFEGDHPSHTPLPGWWWTTFWFAWFFPIMVLILVGNPLLIETDGQLSAYVYLMLGSYVIQTVLALLALALVNHVSKAEGQALRQH